MTKGPVLGSLSIQGEGGPTGIAWSADGRAVMAETRDQTLRMLDEQRSELWRLPGPPPRRVAQIVAGGQRVALTAWTGEATLLDSRDGQVVADLRRSPAEAWSRDQSRAIGRVPDGAPRVWDAMTGGEVCTLSAEGTTSVALSPDGRRALVGDSSGVELWDLDGQPQRIRRHEDRLLALLDRRAITLDGQRVLAGHRDGIIKLWDLASGEQVWSRPVGRHEPKSFAFTDDGRLALSSGSYGVIKVLDLATGVEVSTIQAGTAAARKVGFSPDGREILVACADASFRRFAVADGAELEVVASQGSSDAVAFTPDASRLFLPRDQVKVTTFDAGGAGLLECREGRLPGGTDPCVDPDDGADDTDDDELDDDRRSVSESRRLADGRVLKWVDATEELDSLAWIEDPHSGRGAPKVRGRSVSLAVGSHAPIILAKSWWGGPLELWHAEYGKLATLGLRNDEVRCAAFSPDDRAAAVATHKGRVIRIEVASP